jgi:hypothetical protein
MRAFLSLISAALFCLEASAADRPQLWLYCPTNLAVDQNVEKLRDLWKRAAAVGYEHVLLADSKMAKLGDLGEMTKHYFANVEKTKRIAADMKLELVPALFHVGYSNNMLWHDPNLAEGLPVKDQAFVVHGNIATPATDTKFPQKVSFKDDSVQVEGNIATVKDNPSNARMTYAMKLPRFHRYHVSVWIKTQDYTGQPEISVLGGERRLQCRNLGVQRTQDWTLHHATFNTLDHDSVNVYFGVWGDAKGTLQWKDWKTEEAGLVHLLRRPGAPFAVKSADGQALVEGKDFDQVVDPLLGNHPWKGEYDAWHEPAAIHTHGLADNAKLFVSYYAPEAVYDGQIGACIEEPKTQQLITDEAQRVRAAFGTKGYMMSHDEFRVFGWDESCTSQHKTPGEMLADNARFCTKLLDGAQAYVWNDMFDPYHNAVKGPYYLVNGPWTGSWEGLSSNVIIMNWNFGKRDESLKFFADRGHRQIIAGFYDGPMKHDEEWVASARKVKDVVGYMYTTWRGDYSKIEAYAKTVGINPKSE